MSRRGKYGARKVTLDGYRFDSQAEAAYYRELKMLVRAGEIHHFIVRPQPYELLVNGHLIGRYTPDFEVTLATGEVQIIDVKSKATRLSRDWPLRRKLFNACYAPLTVTEVLR